LQVNLTWNADWDNGSNYTYRPRSDAGIETTFSSNGSNRASVWAFNADYLKLFQRQLDTYYADARLAPGDGTEFGDENGDGRVVLTNASIVQDFRETFLFGLGTVDGRGFLPFPMPNWQVTYSGLGNWPLIRALVQSASLRHGYSSDYTTDYRQNLLTDVRNFDLGRHRINFTMPLDEVGAMRINERFQPVIGVDLSLVGRVQTNVAWNKSTAYSLSTSNFEVSQNETSEITFTTSFQKQGMTLPFFGNRLNNRVSMSLTVSRATLADQRFSIRRGLVDAITSDDFVLADAMAGDNVSVVTASTRITVVPRVSYEFSNRVSADFTMRYENFQSEDSRQPSATTMNGGFNIRVSIANN
jgi:cell surface protein SprA